MPTLGFERGKRSKFKREIGKGEKAVFQFLIRGGYRPSQIQMETTANTMISGALEKTRIYLVL